MKKFILLLFITPLFFPSVGWSQEKATKIVVRAIAKDAKLIGSSMNGAHIKITQASNDSLLAEGKTSGSTGNTDKLVRKPKKRYEQLSTPGSAKFETTIKLSKPILVTISATAPGNDKQSQVTVTEQHWLIPGKDMTGDGIMMEVPGLVVDLIQPSERNVNSGEPVTIKSKLVMMCGCPTKPNGLWDSSEMEIRAVIKKDDEVVARKKLKFTGKTSRYSTEFTPREKGKYNIMVYGFDSRTNNTGVDKVAVTVH